MCMSKPAANDLFYVPELSSQTILPFFFEEQNISHEVGNVYLLVYRLYNPNVLLYNTLPVVSIKKKNEDSLLS